MAKTKAVAEQRENTKSAPAVEQQPQAPEKKTEPAPAVLALKMAVPPPGGSPNVTAAQDSGIAGRARITGSLQRSLGNARISRLYAGQVQTKLKVGAPNDKYEQEADRVAEHVMRMPEPPTRKSTSVRDQTIQRVCASCSEEYKTAENENRAVEPANLCLKCRAGEEGMMQTKQVPPPIQRQKTLEGSEYEELIQTKTAGEVIPEVTPEVSASIQSQQGGGQPLTESERGFFEPRFGADFSAVRVHDTSEDQTVAERLNAKAFTYSDNIWMGPRASVDDRKLMAHELTHVVQQRGRRPLERHPEPVVSALGHECTPRQVAMQQKTQLEQATIGGTDQGLRSGAPIPSGDLRISSPAEAAERHAVNVSEGTIVPAAAPAAQPGLFRSPDNLVPLTGVTVNHDRVTVPPVAGLSFSATITPANASPNVALSVHGDNASIATGTTINNSTGAITVAADQTGGSAHVEASQNATAPDGSTLESTSPATAHFNFTAIPSGITSTSASPGGSATHYGGEFTHTFTSPGGGQTALERSHVNELFPAASGTTLNITGPLGNLSVTVNNPNSATAGWDLDSSGEMAGPDHVTWSNTFDARPFVVNASNPSPSDTLPKDLTATQNFRNLIFPDRAYGTAAVASTTHRRAIEDRNNQLKAVTSANSQEVDENYAGPTVFRRCRAVPDAIPVTVPATSGGTAPAPTTSTITVDAEGQTATPTFIIRPPDLGCTITPNGVLTPGTTAGTVTVRAGDSTNYDETTVTLVAGPSLTNFTINSGATITTNQTVTLDNIAAPSSPTHSLPTDYMASEDAGFSGASWQTYSASPSFTLSEGYGVKTVYLKLKNIAGESNDLNDTIDYLARPALTAFAINNGAASTTNPIVTLDNTAVPSSPTQSEPTHYMASEDVGFAGASWQTYSVSPSFTLSEGYGVKTVYLKLKNDVGDGESGVISDTIEYVASSAPSPSPTP